MLQIIPIKDLLLTITSVRQYGRRIAQHIADTVLIIKGRMGKLCHLLLAVRLHDPHILIIQITARQIFLLIIAVGSLADHLQPAIRRVRPRRFHLRFLPSPGFQYSHTR